MEDPTKDIVRHVSIIDRDGKRYVYDPAQQLFEQTFALDKELVRCKFMEIMAETRAMLDTPELSIEKVTAKITRHIQERNPITGEDGTVSVQPSFEDQRMPEIRAGFGGKTEDEHRWLLFRYYVKTVMFTGEEPAFTDVKEYKRLVAERAKVYQQGLGHANDVIIQMDGHRAFIAHLLIPEGMEYGPASVKAVREILPRLTMEEVESVISNFLSSERTVKRLSANYLTQYQPLTRESATALMPTDSGAAEVHP